MMRGRALVFLASALLMSLFSCGHEDPDGHEEGNGTELSFKLGVTYSCNADSVVLHLDIQDPTGAAVLKVKDDLGRNDLSLPSSTTDCILRHIPGNTQLKLTLDLVYEGESRASKKFVVKTTGYDWQMVNRIMPDKGGVSIGDGTYSVLLPDGKSLFIFQDSNVGEIQEGKLISGHHMYRNSYCLYDPVKGTAKAIVSPGNHSAAVPPGHPEEDEWYWPCDAFTDGNLLYIIQMQHRMVGSGMWGFAYKESRITTYSLPDITLVDDSPIPYELTGDYAPHFGSAVMKDGEWVYLYACLNYLGSEISDAVVARTKPEDIKTSWEFWDGTTWKKDDSSAAVGMEGLEKAYPGTQFSVFKAGGKYIFLNHNHWFWISEVYTLVSDSPTGPWTNMKTIYKIPALEQSNWFTYNAVAHPQFEREGMIPFSFNVNTDNSSEHISNVLSYRPRFVWVDIADILE